MSCRPSFTEQRRARLRKAVDRIERLESRSTITEPISLAGLSVGALRGIAQLGIVQVHGGTDAIGQLAAARRAAAAHGGKAAARLATRQGPGASYVPISVGERPPGDSAPASVGASESKPAAGSAASYASQANDWLDLSPIPSAAASGSGLSTPWHPAKPPAGGPTVAPRGGTGSAIQPYVVAAMRAQTGQGQAAQPPSAPAAMPGVYLPSPPASAGGGAAVPVVARNAAAPRPAQGSGRAPAPVVSPDVSGGGSSVTVVENPSSAPSSSIGNGSGRLLPSFTYFPLYVLDYNDGVVLFPGQYQAATQMQTMDLYAQVTGTTVSSYSWNTSGDNVTGVTGASTYHLHLEWFRARGGGVATEPITLTVTNTSSQQESQTFYFVFPSVETLPSSASWPVTISPDLVEPGAPSIASQNVSVDADSGALDSEIDLPSYNPNVPALSLAYNSLTADPRPIIVVHHTLDPTQAVPSAVNATLTFNSVAGTTWYYNTSSFIAGDIQQIALQANATSLSTGRYSYSVQIVDERSSNTTTTYSGTATVLNQSTSPFGDGWTLQGLEQIIPATGGVILTLGDNGESLWFSGSFGAGGGTYTSPAGDFSTLVLNSNGTYTRTLPDGTQIDFNSSGYETATVDLNNNHTTFSYNGSNQLTSIEDAYGNYTTLTYSSGYLSTIEDPAGRLTTFAFSGSELESVEQADGSFVTYTYDSGGRLTQVADQRSNITSVAYDSAERVGTISLPEGDTQLFSSYQEQGWTNSGTSGSPATAILQAAAATTYTDPNGNGFQVRPDWMGLGQLSQSTDPYGNVTSNDVNSNGLPIVSSDPLGRLTQYHYNSLGNPTKITFADQTNVQYTYNSDSEPLTYTDGNSHTTSYTYDSHGNLTVIEDALLNLTTMTYTSTGQVQTLTDGNNHTTTYQYDSQDRLTTVQFPNATTNLFAYNSQGNITAATDGRSNTTTYSFDALNRETGETDALNDVTTITYDAAGNVTKIQAPTPAGQTARTTTYAYDSMDRLTTVTDPLGLQTVYGYDADGNEVTVTDPLSRTSTTQYDEMDRPTVTIDPRGDRTTATYDADGEVLTVTDPLNGTTTYTYSVRGWVATAADPLDDLATYTYSPTGMLISEYQTLNQVGTTQASYTYDADDWETAYTDQSGFTTSYSYDGVGNVTAIEDPNGNTTSYAYDSINQLTTVTDALGHTTVYGYDNSGNQQTVKDALGHTTTTLYDALDRATTITSAVSGTTTITYDVAGRVTSLTDPVGNKTQWAYDSDDRLTTLTQPNNATVTYVYDNDGEVTDTTDADGRRTTYSYDADGDQTGETWVGSSPSEVITYTYDSGGQLTAADDAYATMTFTYDADGNLATEATSGPGTGQPTVTLTYSHNQLGNVTGISDSLSSQGLTSYTYTADDRLETVTTTYGGTAGPQISFGYDSGGLLTSVSRQVGSSSGATEVNTTISYDAADRITTMTDGVDISGTITPLATYTYGYDNANRMTTQVNADGTYTYTYDDANELTSVYKSGTQVESYSYDPNGNRTGTGYSTTVMNETATSPGTTYTYDNAGNMISARTSSTTTTYTYDYRDRLTEVTTNGTVVATYTYNALDQRIGTDDNGTQTWTVYAGSDPDANPYADFNGSGTLTERYLFGPGATNGGILNEILARTSSGGTTAWYLTDTLGSVRDIVSASGTELDHIVYDSFGNIVTETIASNGDRFKYAGMQYDSSASVYYDHARYYSSAIGRFDVRDPLGFAGGDVNLYRYAGNDVLQIVDPSGEIWWIPILLLLGAAGCSIGCGGGQPEPPPITPGTIPTVGQLEAHFNVIQGLQKGYDDSNPNTPNVDEVYGYVYYDPKYGGVTTGRVKSWPVFDKRGKLLYFRHSPPNPPDGYVTVASWHTHPEGVQFRYDGWSGYAAALDVPSPEDERSAQAEGLPMIVVTPNKVLKHTGPDRASTVNP